MPRNYIALCRIPDLDIFFDNYPVFVHWSRILLYRRSKYPREGTFRRSDTCTARDKGY